MPNNRKLFYIVFILFVSVVVFIAIDMGSRTTAPWNKPKGKDALKKYEIDHFKKKIN